MPARQQEQVGGAAQHLLVGLELLQESVKLAVLAVRLVADAVGVDVGLAARELGLGLGGRAHDLGIALGGGANLAGPLLAVALVVSGLALALAADALEDRRPHAV